MLSKYQTIGIVGSTSMLGAYLQTFYESQGYRVVTIGLRKASIKWDIKTPFSNTLEGLPNIDVVINTAASFDENYPDDLMGVNRDGVKNIYEFSNLVGCQHFLHISTSSANESHLEKNPGDLYALSKSAGDQSLCNLRDKVPWTVIRPTQIVDDKGISKKHQPFFFHVLREASRDSQMYVNGSTDVSRNYIHVADCISAIDSCINHKLTGIRQLRNPEDQTISQLINLAYSRFNSEKRVAYLSSGNPLPKQICFAQPEVFYTRHGASLCPRDLKHIVMGVEASAYISGL